METRLGSTERRKTTRSAHSSASVAPAITVRSPIATAIDTPGAINEDSWCDKAGRDAFVGEVRDGLDVSADQRSTFVSRPLEDGRIIQGPKADILNTHDVDPIDSPFQSQSEVLIDVLVSEEARTHDSTRPAAWRADPPADRSPRS